MKTIFAFVLLVVLCQVCEVSSTCRENMSSEPVILQNPYYAYENRRHQLITHKNVTKNQTISCSNIYSLGQISFEYQSTTYDQFLIVENSNISAIYSMELYKFRNFATLQLNYLHIKNISPGAFTDMTKLRELYLDNNELTEVLNGVFNDLHSLQILNLTNNNIYKIEHVALTGLTSLIEFHFSNNNLSKIIDSVFIPSDKLRYVDFTGNPLESFSFFYESSHIDTLLLADTALTEISNNFSNFTINTFDLSFSLITKIDFSLFPKSNEINLSSNKIVSVCNCQLLEASSLNLDDNQLEKINGTFGQILKINLGHNKFRSIQKSLFGQPKFLLFLDLSYNKLSVFDEHFFHDFTALQTLILQKNQIQNINPILFHGLTNLTFLDLSGNLIDSFQFGVFDSLTNLKLLNISDNRLTVLSHDRFHSLTNLQNFHFDYNQISSFDLSYFPTLSKLSLDHNSWKCQELVRLTNIARSKYIDISRGTSNDVENVHGIACQNSNEIKFSKNTEFSFQDVSQNMQKAINDGIKNSKMDKLFNNYFENSRMDKLFNKDFEDSKFVRYFDDDFSKSNFFKYLSNFKFVVEKAEVNGSKAEKLTALKMLSDQSDHSIFVFSSVVQILILLVLLFYIVYNFLKKESKLCKAKDVSEMELC